MYLTFLPELSPRFLQRLLELTSPWAARAKQESTLTIWPQGTGLGECPRFAGSPGPHLPAPKDPGPTPLSLRPLPSLPHHRPAGAPPSSLAISPSEWLVTGLGRSQTPTPPPCQPIKRVVFIVPPSARGLHMKSPRPELLLKRVEARKPAEERACLQKLKPSTTPQLRCSPSLGFHGQDPPQEAPPNSGPQTIPDSHLHSLFGIGSKTLSVGTR